MRGVPYFMGMAESTLSTAMEAVYANFNANIYPTLTAGGSSARLYEHSQ